jgi:hypothetical protein
MIPTTPEERRRRRSRLPFGNNKHDRQVVMRPVRSAANKHCRSFILGKTCEQMCAVRRTTVEARDFYLTSLKKFVLRTVGQDTHSHQYGTGAITPDQERLVEQLPADSVPHAPTQTGRHTSVHCQVPARRDRTRAVGGLRTSKSPIEKSGYFPRWTLRTDSTRNLWT